ncbi:MAG: MBL fold metallo-hydrolase, partial [Ignavibacteriae bacterium]|nr:MBL fold metallo-hydrolase [Ignavibacteriota bacterium]
MNYKKELFVSVNEARVLKSIPKKGKGTAVNVLLMGTWVGVKKQIGNWYEIDTAGNSGFISKNDVSSDMGLKVFFIDVGQGDAILIEIGKIRILIDGGEDSSLKNYLTKSHFQYLLSKEKKLHFDYVIITHFDSDHYSGLTDIINDSRFTFGTIYHNGIARFTSDKKIRPKKYNTDLGETIKTGKIQYLKTSFDNLNTLGNLKSNHGLQNNFYSFVKALETAQSQGRLVDTLRLTNKVSFPIINIPNHKFKIEVLGPVLINNNFVWFKDSSKTRNGHSVVLKLIYDDVSILFCGDMNELSEQHLLNNYKGNTVIFESDVIKASHHGSPDFGIDFLNAVKPKAAVISSGDNESYSHPSADRLGCLGKYSVSIKPVIFATELARSINRSGKIQFGMINLRSNGKDIYLAQMKEVATDVNIWDSYLVNMNTGTTKAIKLIKAKKSIKTNKSSRKSKP